VVCLFSDSSQFQVLVNEISYFCFRPAENIVEVTAKRGHKL
jgi:hypothetical protein